MVDDGMFRERKHDGRHEMRDRDFVLLHQTEKLLEIELGHRHHGAASMKRQVHDHDHAVNVKNGRIPIATSSSPSPSPKVDSVCVRFATRFRCVSMTPFWRPVVPLE